MPHLQSILTRSLKGRASAHRAMAKSALFADSSARTRLKRYNHHIQKAETLEARALETAKRSAKRAVFLREQQVELGFTHNHNREIEE